MENKLWGDLKTDEEKLEFLKSGRAWITGIIAKRLEPDIIRIYEEVIKLRGENNAPDKDNNQ